MSPRIRPTTSFTTRTKPITSFTSLRANSTIQLWASTTFPWLLDFPWLSKIDSTFESNRYNIYIRDVSGNRVYDLNGEQVFGISGPKENKLITNWH